jgi:3-oxo-5-alpha-steroid 4-dehydrogenase 3 / polyprenol reductase
MASFARGRKVTEQHRRGSDARDAYLAKPMESPTRMDGIRIDLPQLCRVCFILATTAAILANSVPPLKKAWVVYGSRRTDVPHRTPQSSRFLDYAGGFQVPHSWFTSFYIASISSSIFWAFQIVARGHIFKYLVSHSADPAGVPTGMTINQVVIAWAFMALHGTRRLYESISLNKPSQAKMPIMGWAVGIAFYLGVGLSVWVEGVRK